MKFISKDEIEEGESVHGSKLQKMQNDENMAIMNEEDYAEQYLLKSKLGSQSLSKMIAAAHQQHQQQQRDQQQRDQHASYKVDDDDEEDYDDDDDGDDENQQSTIN